MKCFGEGAAAKKAAVKVFTITIHFDVSKVTTFRKVREVSLCEEFRLTLNTEGFRNHSP